MSAQPTPIKNGFVHIPADAHWLEEYLYEMTVFPNGKFDDQVDSTSQALDSLTGPRPPGWGFLQMADDWLREQEFGPSGEPAAPVYQPGSMEWAAQQRALGLPTKRE